MLSNVFLPGPYPHINGQREHLKLLRMLSFLGHIAAVFRCVFGSLDVELVMAYAEDHRNANQPGGPQISKVRT